jgi:glycosyltransferase involved in cell wall biosynthesis
MRFVIFSCGYNAENFVEGHMASIQQQLYKNYVHVIVDDCSSDGTWDRVRALSDNRTVSYRTEKNQKWIANALQFLNSHIESDEDVIALVDLDDSLAHNTVLNKVEKAYRDKDCRMTYSWFRYIKSNQTSEWIPQYDQNTIRKKAYRKVIWSYTHLRTFRAFLWKNIKESDLKDITGNYFKYAYDQAICLPMLEMCAEPEIKFIPDVMYLYNDNNPIQVEKIHRRDQERTARYIRSRPIYNYYERVENKSS